MSLSQGPCQPATGIYSFRPRARCHGIDRCCETQDGICRVRILMRLRIFAAALFFLPLDYDFDFRGANFGY
jgi:hypothetical protein